MSVKHKTMYFDEEVQLHAFLNSSIHKCKCSFACLGQFSPGGAPGNKGQPETCGRPWHSISLAPLQTQRAPIIFGTGQDWPTSVRTRTQNAESFRSNSFACGNLGLQAPFLRLIQRRLNALGSYPTTPLHNAALSGTHQTGG